MENVFIIKSIITNTAYHTFLRRKQNCIFLLVTKYIFNTYNIEYNMMIRLSYLALTLKYSFGATA